MEASFTVWDFSSWMFVTPCKMNLINVVTTTQFWSWQTHCESQLRKSLKILSCVLHMSFISVTIKRQLLKVNRSQCLYRDTYGRAKSEEEKESRMWMRCGYVKMISWLTDSRKHTKQVVGGLNVPCNINFGSLFFHQKSHTITLPKKL